MSTTLSLVVIFVPVAFMTGQVGRYFYSFGITSAAAILISMFVSFTLTPALCATWLKPEDARSDHSTTKSSGWYARMDALYGRMLLWSLQRRSCGGRGRCCAVIKARASASREAPISRARRPRAVAGRAVAVLAEEAAVETID